MQPRSPSGNSASKGFSNILLVLNAVLMVALLAQLSRTGSNGNTDGNLLVAQQQLQQQSNPEPPRLLNEQQPPATAVSAPASSTSSSSSSSQERDFLAIATTTNTDKVEGHKNLKTCLEIGRPCVKTQFERDTCRPWGHFYDSLYQRWLGPLSTDDAEPFQFLEIGFYQGAGFDAFRQFLPRAEAHSIELSCLNDGRDSALGNTAKQTRRALYLQLISTNRLHCGSAADLDFLDSVWAQQMRRANAPPLKVVVDDASHQAPHMVASVFYWFPKIEPGGYLIVEDVQPISTANAFRTQFLPQIMSDMHWCGDPNHPEQAFFDTLWPLLKSISCEMHICIFERNDKPANLDLTRQQLTPPAWALDYNQALQTRKSVRALKKVLAYPAF